MHDACQLFVQAIARPRPLRDDLPRGTAHDDRARRRAGRRVVTARRGADGPAPAAHVRRPAKLSGRALASPRRRCLSDCIDDEIPRDRETPLADAKSARALARHAPGQRSARGAACGAGDARQARGAHGATHAGRRSRPCSPSTCTSGRVVRQPRRAVHRAREPLVEDRRPALAGAVRADAGLPGVLRRVRARDQGLRAAQPSGRRCCRSSSRGRSSISASTRRSGSSATSGGFRRSGRSCTRCSRAPARMQIERQPLAARPDGGPDDDRARVPRRAGAPARRPRQPDAAADRMGRRRSSTNGAGRCGSRVEPRSATHVLRRPRRKHRTAAPRARPARGPRAVPRHAAAARAAAARTARRSNRRSAAIRSPDRSPQQREQLELFVQAREPDRPGVRGRSSRRGERVPASGAVDAIIGFDAIVGLPARRRRAAARAVPRQPELTRTRWSSRSSAVRAPKPIAAIDPARRRLATFAAPGGPWEIKDISSSGFRLHAPMSIATEVRLSMLVAIDRCGQNSWVTGHRPPHATAVGRSTPRSDCS